MNVLIRNVEEDELQVLAEFAKNTFVEAFGPQNTKEDMADYVNKNFSSENIQKEYGHPGSIFLFAEKGGEIVGYLKLNSGSAQTERLLDDALEIERIYVRSDHQGKNVGKQLLEFAISTAKSHLEKWIWLGVWEKNDRAITFYERNGFEIFDSHTFYLGQDKQIDVLMKLKIDHA